MPWGGWPNDFSGCENGFRFYVLGCRGTARRARMEGVDVMKRLLEMENRIRDLESRMTRTVCWGEVCETDPATAKVRVTLPDRDDVVSWWLPVLHHKTLQDKAYFMPDVGEQVVVCFPPVSGMETGFVIGATYNGQDAPPVSSQDKWHLLFKDGSWLEYDRASHNLSGHIKGKVDDFTVDEDVNVKVGGNVSADVGGDVNLTVAGKLTATASFIHLNP